MCPRMHQIAPFFFSKKNPGVGGGGGGVAWLLAFCTRRKILDVSNMVKNICICYMLKGSPFLSRFKAVRVLHENVHMHRLI